MKRRSLGLLVALLSLAVPLAACGDDDGDAASSETTIRTDAFPVTVETETGPLAIDERPERIVSLSATATEILFAIGAGDQVLAADQTSDYPPEAPTTDLSAYEPNVEAIATYEPDLVVLSDDLNGIVAALQAIDVPVLFQPVVSTLDDSYAQIDQLGAATGHVGDAAELVAEMQSEIDDLIASVPELEAPLTYYHELDQTLYSITSSTFIGEAYRLAGLENIADAAQGASSEYPQLSAEYILQADPDLIFLADAECCGVTAESLAQRPGWDQLTALRAGAVIELDEDIASRWGPRVVDLLRIVVESVTALQPAGS